MTRSSPQSALRYPLTVALGAEANVRVLRELAHHGGALSSPSLVARTGLAQSSVRAALIALESIRLVAAIGSGRSRLYRMDAGHPLASDTDRLFKAEQGRFDAVLSSLTDAAATRGNDILSAWIYGSVARGNDGPGSDLDILIVARQGALARAETSLHEVMNAESDRLVFNASIVALEPDDVLRLHADGDPWWRSAIADVIPVFGPRPEAVVAELLDRPSRRKAS